MVKYGNFITAIVDFLIIAFSIFLIVRYINKLNKIKELGDFAASKIDKNGKFIKHKEEHKEEHEEEPKEPLGIMPEVAAIVFLVAVHGFLTLFD